MISYNPLWETMKKKGFTTYTLRQTYNMSGSTIDRLKNNKPISTVTLNDICKILNCSLSEVAEYIEEET